MPSSSQVSHTGVLPGAVDDVFARTIAEPLPHLFRRRFLAIPPISEVRDQSGAWGTPGQTRTIVLADGGTMRETLTVVDAPHRFAYAIDAVTGPMSPLVAGVTGTWSFAPEGPDRTRVTWEWVIVPRHYAAPAVPAFTAMWRGMARRAFEDLKQILRTRS